MVTVGKSVIVTCVVTRTALHPPATGVEYVTVYSPGVLVLAVIAPVVGFMLRPSGAE